MPISIDGNTLRQLLNVSIVWSICLLAVHISMILLRVRNPRTRYNVLWATYCMVLPAWVTSAWIAPLFNSVPVPSRVFVNPSAALPVQSNNWDLLPGIVVSAIAVGAFVFLLRWVSLRRQLRHVTPCDSARVGLVVEQLSADLGVRAGVRCLVAQEKLSPCSVGAFRPVIMMNKSYIDEVNARTLNHVVAHELVHIRRHDYARNLVQKFIRSIFFFNPLALWFDRQIDEWREVSCDREVLESVHVNRRAYAETLLDMGLRLQEQWAGSPSVAFFRHGSSLRRRIKQMKLSQTRDAAAKTILVTSLVVTAFVVISCSNKDSVIAPTTTTQVQAPDTAAESAAFDVKLVKTGADGALHYVVERDDGNTLLEFHPDSEVSPVQIREAVNDMAQLEFMGKDDRAFGTLHEQDGIASDGDALFELAPGTNPSQEELKEQIIAGFQIQDPTSADDD